MRLNDSIINKTYRGTITNWQLHHTSISQAQLDAIADEAGIERMLPLVITGTVLEDPSCRMRPGWHMRTTPLTHLNEEAGYCETKNSVYRLDGPNGCDQFQDMGDAVFSIVY